jgi:hypothetical protein
MHIVFASDFIEASERSIFFSFWCDVLKLQGMLLGIVVH